MKSPQRCKIALPSTLQHDRLAQIEKIMQNHTDPDPVCYIPPQRTENDECLYQFQLFEPKQPHNNNRQAPDSRINIELTLALTAQNDEMARKIKEIKDLLNSEQLKASIFKKKIQDNQKTICELHEKKDKMHQEKEKIKTLNESSIPNKYTELNTTGNTNAWLNEFLNKSELENLWSKQKEKQTKNVEAKIKSYTIDLSTFMNSARQKNEKAIEKMKASQCKGFDERLKSKGSTKILTTRPLSSKPSQKVQLSQKQRTLNKNLSQLRNMKKARCNPEL